MPILKQPKIGDNTTDLQYLSFEDARKLPFTNKFQPSLEITILRVAAKKKKTIAAQHFGASRWALAPKILKPKNKSNFKIGIASKVRGVVGCINCMKPRCIYSLSAVSRMKSPLPPPDSDNVSTGSTSQVRVYFLREG